MKNITPWTYNGKIISGREDLPENAVGIIYILRNINTNKNYIGKKILAHKKTLKGLKGSKRKRHVVVDSHWMEYTGSCDLLNEDISKGHIIEKEIIHICYSKKQMSYYELKYQMINNVLENDNFYNSNIMGRFFRRDV